MFGRALLCPPILIAVYLPTIFFYFKKNATNVTFPSNMLTFSI